MKKSIWIKHFFCLLAFLIVGTFPAISIGNHYDFKLIGSQNGMPSIISCIYTEQKGFIWIGTPTGLIRFDGTELKKYTAQPDNENSLPNDSILQIIEDNQQTTWILTTTGIARYSLIHDNFFIPKLNNQPIIAKSICKIADGLLFGGINKIYKYSYATNTISLIREFKTDEPFIIRSIQMWKPDTILCLSWQQGILQMNLKNFEITPFPFQYGNDNVGIIIDSQQRIWLSTYNNGVTHKQYYQLDMNQDADGDGESDIVVWYTLSNHGIYEQSPKDVRNNYYIYTMGNVTYSGVGHSDFSNNEDELKLYINTMIAAYSASVHEPSIYLKENADTDSNDISTLYATIDDAIEEDAANKADARLDGADSTQDVYFTVKDSNLVRNQIDEKTVVYLDFYIEDPQKNPNDETIGTGDDKIYLKKVDWDIYSLNNDGTENELINDSKENGKLNKDPRDFFENNKTYKVKVPLDTLPEGNNSIKIYAVGYSKIYQSLASGGDKETATAKAYKTFQIQRVGLADLD